MVKQGMDLLARAEQGRDNLQDVRQFRAIPLCEWLVSSLAMKLIRGQRDLVRERKAIHPQGVSLGTHGVEMLANLGLKVSPPN